MHTLGRVASHEARWDGGWGCPVSDTSRAVRRSLLVVVVLVVLLTALSPASSGARAAAREAQQAAQACSSDVSQGLELSGGLQGHITDACPHEPDRHEINFFGSSPDDASVPFSVALYEDPAREALPDNFGGKGGGRVAVVGPNGNRWITRKGSGTVTFTAKGGNVDAKLYNSSGDSLRVFGFWVDPTPCTPTNRPGPMCGKSTRGGYTDPGGGIHDVITRESHFAFDLIKGKAPADNEPAICPGTRITGGYAEPTQGVWQNDATFGDRPGKQQRQVTPTSYVAELAMVKDRPTVLVGRDHKAVELTGVTTGTTAVRATLRFKSHGAGGNLSEREPVPTGAPIGPPCAKKRSFSMRVPALQGVPIPPKQAFVFTSVGRYRIEIGLEARRTRIPGRVDIKGRTVQTTPLDFAVVPVFIDETNCTDDSDKHGLVKSATATAAALSTELADYYPMAPGSVSAAVVPAQCLGDLVDRTERTDAKVRDVVGAELELRLGTEAPVAYDRFVAMFTGPDWNRIYPGGVGLGYAAAPHVVLVPRFTFDHLNVRTAAHELAHTFPYPWGGGEALALCGPPDYHNDKTVGKIADGVRITTNGREDRERLKDYSIFQGTGETTWIDQCTYYHLLKELSDG